MRFYRSTALSLSLSLAYHALPAGGQSYQTHNLTPDGYYHNRYHALLSMAVYGDYNTLCPNQTFTKATELKNFPDATRPPWTVVSTFGPTPSGAEGFTAIVPEMNKALIIFKGNLALEQSLSTESVLLNESMGIRNCQGCLGNAFAIKGYLEAKNETNNWEAIIGAYEGQGLVFSIGGHGLGGMHSQIAGIDLYQENTDYYNHAYGAPRVFNQAGATFYNNRFNGEAGERGIANNDQMTESIPEGVNYTHAGTPFYYWGYNHTSTGMNWRICWEEDNPDTSACLPVDQGTNTTALEDHYYYFSNVGQCGGEIHQNASAIDAFLATDNSSAIISSVSAAEASSESVISASSASVVSVSSASVVSVSEASVSSVSSSEAAAAAATAPSATPTPTATTAPKSSGAALKSGLGAVLLAVVGVWAML